MITNTIRSPKWTTIVFAPCSNRIRCERIQPTGAPNQPRSLARSTVNSMQRLTSLIRGDDKHPDKSKTVVPAFQNHCRSLSQFSVEPIAIPLQSSFLNCNRRPAGQRSKRPGNAWIKPRRNWTQRFKQRKPRIIDPATTDWDHRLRDNVAYCHAKAPGIASIMDFYPRSVFGRRCQTHPARRTGSDRTGSHRS